MSIPKLLLAGALVLSACSPRKRPESATAENPLLGCWQFPNPYDRKTYFIVVLDTAVAYDGMTYVTTTAAGHELVSYRGLEARLRGHPSPAGIWGLLPQTDGVIIQYGTSRLTWAYVGAVRGDSNVGRGEWADVATHDPSVWGDHVTGRRTPCAVVQPD